VRTCCHTAAERKPSLLNLHRDGEHSVCAQYYLAGAAMIMVGQLPFAGAT